MKMPSINVVFKEKGISAIERSERGIVLMILKEETLPSEFPYIRFKISDVGFIEVSPPFHLSF